LTVRQFFGQCRNQLTADYLINDWQLERLTASYDRNTTQLDALLSHAHNISGKR